MHCLAPPFINERAELKYKDPYPFIDTKELIRRLNDGEAIKEVTKSEYRAKVEEMKKARMNSNSRY